MSPGHQTPPVRGGSGAESPVAHVNSAHLAPSPGGVPRKPQRVKILNNEYLEHGRPTKRPFSDAEALLCLPVHNSLGLGRLPQRRGSRSIAVGPHHGCTRDLSGNLGRPRSPLAQSTTGRSLGVGLQGSPIQLPTWSGSMQLRHVAPKKAGETYHVRLHACAYASPSSTQKQGLQAQSAASTIGGGGALELNRS